MVKSTEQNGVVDQRSRNEAKNAVFFPLELLPGKEIEQYRCNMCNSNFKPSGPGGITAMELRFQSHNLSKHRGLAKLLGKPKS